MPTRRTAHGAATELALHGRGIKGVDTLVAAGGACPCLPALLTEPAHGVGAGNDTTRLSWVEALTLPRG